MPHSPFLAAALDAASAAAEVIRRYYQRNLDVKTKADKSPVTQADIEAEQVIRRILGERFPSHGFYGEETGKSGLDADYLWLVDPIDGTKAFVREYPMFSTQIALMHRGRLIVGVSSAPIYGELAYAESYDSGSGASLQPAAQGPGERRGAHGCGQAPPASSQSAHLNELALSVSAIDTIEGCAISSGNLKTLASGPHWSNYGRLVARANRIRGYGDFLHYHLLAAGKIDVVIESDVNILDVAALAVIVAEAGGKFTDLRGDPIDLDTTSVLATNGRLHESVLEMLYSSANLGAEAPGY